MMSFLELAQGKNWRRGQLKHGMPFIDENQCAIVQALSTKQNLPVNLNNR